MEANKMRDEREDKGVEDKMCLSKRKGTKDTSASCPLTSSRSDSSLYILTRKFIMMINSAPKKIIDLNQAAHFLGVSKRRVYDITNVLEGLGLLTKYSVNNAKWQGEEASAYLGEENEQQMRSEVGQTFDNKDELEKLQREEHLLDRRIEKLNAEISELALSEWNMSHAYVTYKDLYSLPSLKGKLVFAVKAPQDTYLENPKEKISNEYVVRLNANEGKIDVYYVSDDKL